VAGAKEKKAEPIRLGIIGSGLAVKLLHWPALKKMSDKYRIVVCCDVDREAAQEVARLAEQDLNSPGCRVSTAYEEVLAADDVEAVLLSLPIHLTSQFILDAVRAGKHVISEKPLAANLKQGQELVETLRAFSAIKVQIAENYHYRSDFSKAKEWIAAGRIGQPFLVQMISRFWTDPSSGFSSTPWRQDNQYRGGIFADAGVHQAAALRELGGEIEQLQAFTKSVHPVMGGQDTVVLNLRFRSGAIGSLVFAGAAKDQAGGMSLVDILGTTGAINIANGKVVLTEGSGKEAKLVEEFSDPDHDGGYFGEFENFYRAIRENAPVVSTVEEALKDWEIIMCALDSAEARKVILL
jgi:predicted dehydrogenase